MAVVYCLDEDTMIHRGGDEAIFRRTAINRNTKLYLRLSFPVYFAEPVKRSLLIRLVKIGCSVENTIRCRGEDRKERFVRWLR